MTLPPAIPHNFAQVHERLGGVPLARIRVQPPPGAATEDDLLCSENRGCELVDGILVEKPAVGFYESYLAAEILGILREFVKRHRLGLVFTPDLLARMHQGNVRQPDVSFYSWSRFPDGRLPADRIAGMAPDLAVEVLSPSNTSEEMQRKRTEYFASGCRLVWEVEPELRQVCVYTSETALTLLTASDLLTGEPVLPGFTLALCDLFTLPEAPAEGTLP